MSWPGIKDPTPDLDALIDGYFADYRTAAVLVRTPRAEPKPIPQGSNPAHDGRLFDWLIEVLYRGPEDGPERAWPRRRVENRSMSSQWFELVAEVSSDNPAALEPLLRELVGGEITATADGFHVVAVLTGESPRELNRALLSALRRVERRTRLRAAWTAGGVTEHFFDYALKTVRSTPR